MTKNEIDEMFAMLSDFRNKPALNNRQKNWLRENIKVDVMTPPGSLRVSLSRKDPIYWLWKEQN